MQVTDLNTTNVFDAKAMRKFLIHDSAWFRIINFNIPAGQTFPVHSHDLDGQLSIQILAGEGFFLGADKAEIPARQGKSWSAISGIRTGLRPPPISASW